GPRAGAARPAVGTGARHRAGARPGSPPRGPRGGAGDRAGRGSRAWLGRLAPSGARDAPRPPGAHSPGSGSPGHGGGALAAAPEGSFGSEPRLPRGARPRRAASPPGSRRTPGAETSPRKRARPPRGRTGRADPGLPAPRRRRGPPPGTVLPARRDRARGAGPSPRAGPARPLAAAPWLAWLQTHAP